MTDVTEQARKELLDSSAIDSGEINTLLGRIMTSQVDAGEIFFQRNRSENWSLEDGRVKDSSFSVNQGVGIRAIQGEKTGFAFSNEISSRSLQQASDAARSIARSGGDQKVSLARPISVERKYQPLDPTVSMTEDEKVKLLNRMDRLARSLDNRVEQVMLNLSAAQDSMFVCNSQGVEIGDIRPLVHFSVSVFVSQGNRREVGFGGCGGRYGLGRMVETEAFEGEVKEAVRSAIVNLDAEDAPAGEMPVVLAPGWPGILLHEAVGHGLEGDFNRKGTSKFSGRVGEQVASKLCTVIDDGTIAERRGSLTIDDEGTPTQRTVLIEEGRLCGYMQDTLNARLSGVEPTGNGRRQSYAHLPLPRMTNTYMLGGESEPGEIFESIKDGVYAVKFSGGQVDITNGSFVFSATEAYRIVNGKVSHPLRNATLIGDGLDVMNKISMVGNDFAMDHGIGVCGKEGQGVPVGVGQPTLKVDSIRVGGTAA